MKISKKQLLPCASLLLIMVSAHGFAEDDCPTAFMKSSAAQTCSGNEVTTEIPAGTCNFDQTCLGKGTFSSAGGKWMRTSPDRARNIVSVPLKYVKQLVNCDSMLSTVGC
ncbi:hypothetical protein LRS56_17015 [Pseudomonas poae]|nr:hypothetical protein LRS56_17015 [Pseudomonas poae]